MYICLKAHTRYDGQSDNNRFETQDQKALTADDLYFINSCTSASPDGSDVYPDLFRKNIGLITSAAQIVIFFGDLGMPFSVCKNFDIIIADKTVCGSFMFSLLKNVRLYEDRIFFATFIIKKIILLYFSYDKIKTDNVKRNKAGAHKNHEWQVRSSWMLLPEFCRRGIVHLLKRAHEMCKRIKAAHIAYIGDGIIRLRKKGAGIFQLLFHEIRLEGLACTHMEQLACVIRRKTDIFRNGAECDIVPEIHLDILDHIRYHGACLIRAFRMSLRFGIPYNIYKKAVHKRAYIGRIEFKIAVNGIVQTLAERRLVAAQNGMRQKLVCKLAVDPVLGKRNVQKLHLFPAVGHGSKIHGSHEKQRARPEFIFNIVYNIYAVTAYDIFDLIILVPMQGITADYGTLDRGYFFGAYFAVEPEYFGHSYHLLCGILILI